MTDKTLPSYRSAGANRGTSLIILAWIALSVGAYWLMPDDFPFNVENPFRPLIGYGLLLGIFALLSPFSILFRLFFFLAAAAGIALYMLAMGVLFVSIFVAAWNFPKGF